ncbi:GNAT family N-acetyltransferase [Roseibium litorale]|uniref:GNAT family N-acetyltransferase n=1 Tax=Roseibium litorale TaxID=2803841 RepID=A0ABR9CNY9_9HYPH|nr:GNAT family N-acetyltransferase [Roseibium litorale]MBD8892458.1 GNAT family N-acetyltransferase [Roseibium litorale]
MTLPVLKTDRLILRPQIEADLPRLVELIGDYEVSKMLSVVPYPYTLADGQEWLARVNEEAGNAPVAFAIDAGEGVIGVVSLGKLPAAPVLGYWLGRAYWGKGYMSEACRSVLSWLFGTTQVTEIAGRAFNENAASLNVMRKLGFSDERDTVSQSLARGAEDLPATSLVLTRDTFLKTVSV